MLVFAFLALVHHDVTMEQEMKNHSSKVVSCGYSFLLAGIGFESSVFIFGFGLCGPLGFDSSCPLLSFALEFLLFKTDEDSFAVNS